jgi:ferredoxin
VSGEIDVRVDPDLCMGAGECVFFAPTTFSLGQAGHAEVATNGADDEATIRLAARRCPNFAITVTAKDSVQPS